MYFGKRVIVVTPAGRKRYLELLIPQVLRSPLVDAYHLWMNTTVPEDCAFIEEQARVHDRIHPKYANDAPVGSLRNIGSFFKQATDPDAIYIRLDDDICYLDEGFFEKLLRARVENPKHLLVSPFVVNNSMCSFLLQCHERIHFDSPLSGDSMCAQGWANPMVAEEIHRLFLKAVAQGDLSLFRIPDQSYFMARFSINCISWFGHDFAAFGGTVFGDEEHYLTMTLPFKTGRSNLISGQVLACHFAFHTQRDHLEETDILEQYAQIERCRGNATQRLRLDEAERQISQVAHNVNEIERNHQLRRIRAQALTMNHPRNELILGWIDLRLGEKQAALERLTEFVGNHPSDISAVVLLAEAFLDLGSPQRALQLLKPLLRATDVIPDVLVLTAHCVVLLGQMEMGAHLLSHGFAAAQRSFIDEHRRQRLCQVLALTFVNEDPQEQPVTA